MKKGDIWFMMEYSTKEKTQNILSVVAGVLTGLALISLLNLILLLTMATSSRNGESPENSSLFKILAVATIVISCLIAGFVTAKISTRKTFIHVPLTGIVLLLVIAGIGDFNWKDFSTIDWLGLLLTVPCTILGGLRQIRKQSATKI
jgi:putative membrane protein (TIGR04086 family)